MIKYRLLEGSIMQSEEEYDVGRFYLYYLASDIDADRAKDKEEIARAFERGVLAMRDAALNAIDVEALGRISEKLGLGTFEAEEVGQIRDAADKLLAREALEGKKD